MGFHFGTIVAVAVACASLSAPYTGVDAQGADQYLGCFNDKKGSRVFEMKTVKRSNNSPFNCGQTCLAANLPVMGLENGVQCWCGPSDTDFDQHGAASNCNDPCPGTADATCGQHLKFDAYRLSSVSETSTDVSFEP